MSVTPDNLQFYGSANMPEADGSTVGGAPDFTKRVSFYDIAPSGTVDVVSTATGDTATLCHYYGQDVSGAVQNQTLTLNGRTWVTGSQALERLLYAALSGAATGGPVSNPGGTAATGDVALAAHAAVLPAGAVAGGGTHTAQSGSANTTGATPPLFHLASGDGATLAATANAGVGLIIWISSGTGAFQLRRIVATSGYGTDVVAVSRDWGTVPDATSTYQILQGMLFEILPTAVTAIIRVFSNTAAQPPGGSQITYYEKIFLVNNNTATALTGAQDEVALNSPSLPSGALIDIGLTAALNDTGTAANRQTAPSGITFTTQPAYVPVPSPGNLPSGAAPNAAGAQGVWMRLILPAATPAFKGYSVQQTQGVTA